MDTNSQAEFEAELENLAVIRRFVENEAAKLKVDPAVVPDVLLAVTEVATNTIVHGYQEGEGKIVVEMEKEGSRLLVRLRDHAPLFDPTLVPPPDVTLPLEDRPLGGFSLHVVWMRSPIVLRLKGVMS
jgi:anti-sigma regulatory factor (Ser/Thr protein kinase)